MGKGLVRQISGTEFGSPEPGKAQASGVSEDPCGEMGSRIVGSWRGSQSGLCQTQPVSDKVEGWGWDLKVVL